MTPQLRDITDRLARLAPDAPRCSIELEAKNLLAHLSDSAEYGLPVTDSELEAVIENSQRTLEAEARLAKAFAPITEERP